MTTKIERPTFIDLFAGCRELSLGLMSQGWQGLFAVEREAMAFHTLVFNLLYNPESHFRFLWPEWLRLTRWISKVLGAGLYTKFGP